MLKVNEPRKFEYYKKHTLTPFVKLRLSWILNHCASLLNFYIGLLFFYGIYTKNTIFLYYSVL